MTFQRKPGLGHYNESRSAWRAAYRQARLDIAKGLEPNHKLDGVRWKAQLVVAYEREGLCDNLRLDAAQKLEAQRLVNELLAEG